MILFFFAFRDALWLLQWILGGRRKAAWKFFGSPLFQPLDDILHPLPVVFKADFSISVIERADFSHDPLQIHLLLACLPDVHWGGGTNISSGGGEVKFWKNTSLIVFEAHSHIYHAYLNFFATPHLMPLSGLAAAYSAGCCPLRHPEYQFWGMDVPSISDALTISWVNYVKRVKKSILNYWYW